VLTGRFTVFSELQILLVLGRTHLQRMISSTGSSIFPLIGGAGSPVSLSCCRRVGVVWLARGAWSGVGGVGRVFSWVFMVGSLVCVLVWGGLLGGGFGGCLSGFFFGFFFLFFVGLFNISTPSRLISPFLAFTQRRFDRIMLEPSFLVMFLFSFAERRDLTCFLSCYSSSFTRLSRP